MLRRLALLLSVWLASCTADMQLPEADQVLGQRMERRALFCATVLRLDGSVVKKLESGDSWAKCLGALRSQFAEHQCVGGAHCPRIEIAPKADKARTVDGTLEVRCGVVSHEVIAVRTHGDEATILYKEVAELDDDVEVQLADCGLRKPTVRTELELTARRHGRVWQ